MDKLKSFFKSHLNPQKPEGLAKSLVVLGTLTMVAGAGLCLTGNLAIGLPLMAVGGIMILAGLILSKAVNPISQRNSDHGDRDSERQSLLHNT